MFENFIDLFLKNKESRLIIYVLADEMLKRHYHFKKVGIKFTNKPYKISSKLFGDKSKEVPVEMKAKEFGAKESD